MNVKKNNVSLAFQGAVILTIAGLITKVMSAAYRIPFQNIVGDIGFYIYQQVYPFYGMSIILATSGFPVVISKVMTDFGYDKSNQIRSKILTIAFLYLLLIGLTIATTFYLFSDNLAIYMGDAHLTPLIQVTAIIFLIIPFTSIIRGYFQSQQNMQPTAFSQVIEQGIRVVCILFASYLMVRSGRNLYEVGFGALVGSIVGSLAALIMLVMIWISKKRHTAIKWNVSAPIHSLSILYALIKYSWTIGISSLLLILIQLIDALNLYALLIDGGMGEVLAKETKGVYDRGQPLIQLGTVVATALALSLVPIIASAQVQKNFSVIQDKVNLALKVCIVIGAGATAGLISIMRPANVMLFTNDSGSVELMVLSGSILFTSLCLTVFAILQGLGYTYIPALSVIVGIVVKYSMNIWLIPLYGVLGAAISTLVSFFIIAAIGVIYMVVKGYYFTESKSLVKVGLATLLMMGTLTISLNSIGLFLELDNRFYATVATFICMFIGGSVYGWLIIKFKVFSHNELQFVPIIKNII